ncbi:hydrogenase nickel incorporation protein HypB [Acetobacterium wieringae]|uniref:Hydrogenase nickel incorporation protein HypB n=1 Tax=Acetobacterium wieringae TaxID=52694 RepID=A0ABY6HII9_9FIRM|nr:hydrogenase nickel incorporation protein HypB [Acetobacterium wieringae]UYO64357.1 hydrogenase nickel incorporation protein HypB [Acetobacterium wieringae]VUZ27134.1 Hydrogenase maturation factor HypB [Acetobacterium wieringae]
MKEDFKIIEIKKSVFENNDLEADRLREKLKKEKTFLLNMMSSPGSGKTSTIVKIIEALKDEMMIGVMEADIDSDVDAQTIAETGTKAIQLHTGGMCHLDAGMTESCLNELGTNDLDFVILENVGNLVCPAEFDTGASKNAMILSVPEGDDKPLKYPLMFSIVDILIINKIDCMEYFNFDLTAVKERVHKLNPKIKIIPISAKTGAGINDLSEWIRENVILWNQGK